MERREYLVGLGGLGISTLAGCTGGGEDEDDEETPTPVYDISVSLPAEAKVGEEVTLEWTVENIGDATGEGVVRIRAETNGDEEVLDEREVAIAPGEIIDGTIVETPSVTGEVTVFVEAPGGGSASSTLQVVNPVDEEQAAEHINTAREELDSAIGLLLEDIDNDETDLDKEAFDGNLDAAEAALEQAGPVATDEQQAVIDSLRQYAEFLSLWADAHLGWMTVFAEQLSSGQDTYWAGRDYYFKDNPDAADYESAAGEFEQAAETFEEGRQEFDATQQTADEAKTILDDISPGVVNEFENIGYDESVNEIEGLQWAISEFATFAAGLREGGNAWVHVSNGAVSLVNEAWESAIDELELARVGFDTAVTELEQFADEELTFVFFLFPGMACEIGNGVAAVDHWISGAEAAQEGDQQTYEEEIAAGQEVMAECHED